jgi:hypothetical protein
MKLPPEFEWVVSPGLREPPAELRPTGLRFSIIHHHPDHLRYRNGSIQLVTLTLTTADWAWVAVKDTGGRRRSAVIIFRARAMSEVWEKRGEGFTPESLPAEKIALRLVREGFGRILS